MKGFGEKNQSKKEKISHHKQKLNSGELIKKAFDLQAHGRQLEAAKYYEYLIKHGIKDCRVFSIMEYSLTRSENIKNLNQNLKKQFL